MIDGYEAMHLIRRGRSVGCRRVMWPANVVLFILSLASLRNPTLNIAGPSALSRYLQQIHFCGDGVVQNSLISESSASTLS